MEELWINEFIYTKDIITEYQKKWWAGRQKAGYALVVVTAVLFLAIACFENKISPGLFFPPAYLILLKVCLRANVRKECERIKMLYGSKEPQVHVEVGRDVCLKSEGKERRLSLSDIRKVLETKNLILICFKGQMIVQLYKPGFIKGDAKTCVAYLKSKIKSR